MIAPFASPAFQARIKRRTFLRRSGVGLGSLALANLLYPNLVKAASLPTPLSSGGSRPGDGRWRGVIHPPHLPVKAKRVIHLCMAGGPSHLETFDPKPELKRL